MKTRTIVTLTAVWLSFCSPVLAQWVRAGLDSQNVYTLAINHSNGYIFAGCQGRGVFRSTNDGTSWEFTGLTNPCVGALAISGTNLFAGTGNRFCADGEVFLSTDSGTSWTAADTTGLAYSWVRALAINGTNLFAGTSNAQYIPARGVFLSTNNGTSWTAVDSGLTRAVPPPLYPSVAAFAASGTNLFAGTSDGVFLSTNNGTSWTAASAGLTNTDIFALTLIDANLFAGTYGGGVFRSTNNGTNWTAVNAGLTDSAVTAFAVSGTNLFAAVNIPHSYGRGVFLSTNNGASWAAVNTGLNDTDITSLVVTGTNLFAGTSFSPNRGLWRRPLSEMIMSVREVFGGSVPTSFVLEQNYPNPFNPTTTIRFAIPVGTYGHTSLRVYDVLGREVKTQVNEDLKAGSYETTFNASELASGVYLYRLQAGDFVQTKKLMLLR